MEIESVDLQYITDDKSDVPNFVIHYKDTDATTTLSSDATTNRHYHEVKEWHEAQKKKPFKFTFEG